MELGDDERSDSGLLASEVIWTLDGERLKYTNSLRNDAELYTISIQMSDRSEQEYGGV